MPVGALPPGPESSGTPRRGVAVFVALSLLFAAGLALRLVGIGHGLPQRMDPDALLLVHPTEAYWSGGGEEFRLVRGYPTLIPRIAGWTPDPRVRDEPPRSLDDHLRLAAASHRRVRIVVACLSTLIVPGTWMLARVFMDAGPALLAAGFATVSLLDVFLSRQARPHAPAAALAVLAVVAALHARRRATLASTVLAGTVAGLAIGALQSGAAVLTPLAIACVTARGRSLPRGLGHLALGMVAASIVTALFLPADPVAMPVEASQQQRAFIPFFGHRVYYDMFSPVGFRNVWKTLWTCENVTTVLAILGLVSWLASGAGRRASGDRRRDLAVVLAYVVPYVALLGIYALTRPRLCVQLVPYVACLAAFATARLARHLGGARGERLAGTILAAAVLSVPALGTLRLVLAERQPDTTTQAARWIAENVGPDERIQLVHVELPLFKTDDVQRGERTMPAGPPWWRYQVGLDERFDGPAFQASRWPLGTPATYRAAIADPIAYFGSIGTDYVVLPVPDVAPPAPQTPGKRIRETLQGRAPLVARFPSDERPVFSIDSGRLWTWRLLGSFRANGPPIEIYRLTSAETEVSSD